MEIQYRLEGPFHLAGIKVLAPWGELAAKVPQVWARLLAETEGMAGQLDQETLYGPSVEGAEYTVWCCIAFDPAAALPEGWERLRLPARTYATARYQGPGSGITAAYQAIFAAIQAAGRSREAGAPGLERYARRSRDMGRRAAPEEPFDYEILVPLDA